MDKNRKISTHNEKKIAENWGYIKRNVKLSDVVDPLIENGIITIDQWMRIKGNPVGEPEKMEEFLYILLKQKSEAFDVFKYVLRKAGFLHIADCLGEKSSNKYYVTSTTDFKNSMINVPTTEEKDDSNKEETQQKPGTVRQKDLDEIKQELKDDMHKMQENLSSEILVLQQKHKHLENDFEKLQSEKCELLEHLGDLQKEVNGLKNKLKGKEQECMLLKIINDKLKDDLRDLNIEHSKANELKEKDLEKKLQEKTDEYKRLQGAMANLKDEHEKRLNRLKSINTEKVRLEDHNKKLLAEKQDAETKCHALGQEAEEAQIKYNIDVSTLQSNIDQLEKDKTELVMQLDTTEKKNAKLMTENKRIEDVLRKTEGLRRQSHIVPNFNSVAKNRSQPKSVWRSGNQGK